jgi:MGT family glycosyltransferase
LIPSAPLPPLVFFDTSFASEKSFFPNNLEEKIMFDLPKLEKIKMFISIFRIIPKVKSLAKQHEIKYMFPLQELFEVPPKVKRIVAIFPGFQARHHLLPKNIKFIGPCIDESVRVYDVNEDLERVLDRHQPVNPVKPNEREIKDKALVYISMGTVFSNNLPLYSKIIDSLLLLKDDCSLEDLKFENIDFVISAGKTLDGLLSKYTELPSNILILQSAPQLEILKRASLFVTHCGMNSMNEAIYYGVPIIGIPINADQPLVAHRATTELGVGLSFDFVSLKPIELKGAITTILGDDDYGERTFKLSQDSRMYNGKENGANEIIQFIKSQKIENNCRT